MLNAKSRKIAYCPFCNNSASLTSSISAEPDYFSALFEIYVQCDFCEAKGKAFLSKRNPEEYNYETYECKSAIDAWNHRENSDDNFDPCSDN